MASDEEEEQYFDFVLPTGKLQETHGFKTLLRVRETFPDLLPNEPIYVSQSTAPTPIFLEEDTPFETYKGSRFVFRRQQVDVIFAKSGNGPTVKATFPFDTPLSQVKEDLHSLAIEPPDFFDHFCFEFEGHFLSDDAQLGFIGIADGEVIYLCKSQPVQFQFSDDGPLQTIAIPTTVKTSSDFSKFLADIGLNYSDPTINDETISDPKVIFQPDVVVNILRPLPDVPRLRVDFHVKFDALHCTVRVESRDFDEGATIREARWALGDIPELFGNCQMKNNWNPVITISQWRR